ncbi:hypothetical protein ACCO45_001814 [Purpureocillium lilacinum]|uniref:Uncharacterized protein n=1 Tax=Purpureocillium lilacinum TaxID=33203 RepID=A0ACC4E833_PURLI
MGEALYPGQTPTLGSQSPDTAAGRFRTRVTPPAELISFSMGSERALFEMGGEESGSGLAGVWCEMRHATADAAELRQQGDMHYSPGSERQDNLTAAMPADVKAAVLPISLGPGIHSAGAVSESHGHVTLYFASLDSSQTRLRGLAPPSAAKISACCVDSSAAASTEDTGRDKMPHARSAGQPRLSFDSELRRRGHPAAQWPVFWNTATRDGDKLATGTATEEPASKQGKAQTGAAYSAERAFPAADDAFPEWTGCGRCVSLHSTVACRAAQRRSSPTRSAPDELQPGVTSHGMAFEGP